ncbi:DUF758 domain-containing protein [Candidatus Parcubacteria bacterium]|nr:DUF758 domain-containing protein [Candidatus Parcubacteria bacterium]
MEVINYQNIIDKLLEKFPEYKDSPKYYDELNKDLPYIVLGNLCLMAFEKIDEKEDHQLAERLVKYADEIFNNFYNNHELVNLFQVEVLENLTASRTGAQLAKKFLHDKSLDRLEQTLKHYHTDSFLEEYRKV